MTSVPVDEMTSRVARLEALLGAQQHQIDELRLQNAEPRGRTPSRGRRVGDSAPSPRGGAVGRRQLLRTGIGAAGAMAAGAVLLDASPTAAAERDNAVLGVANHSGGATTTFWAEIGNGNPAMRVSNVAVGPAIQVDNARSDHPALTAQGPGDGVFGLGGADAAGVHGTNLHGIGVHGETFGTGPGVQGTTVSSAAVRGLTETGTGVFGWTDGAKPNQTALRARVYGLGRSGSAGVRGRSGSGPAGLFEADRADGP